ncbi:MAG: hypothetical protein ACXVY5_02195, partial [Gaiellales bacterium]
MGTLDAFLGIALAAACAAVAWLLYDRRRRGEPAPPVSQAQDRRLELSEARAALGAVLDASPMPLLVFD